MGDSAPDYIDGMWRNIVGIEVTINSLVGKSKLSQNKSQADRLGAVDSLQARSLDELARLMRDAAGPD